MAKTNSVKMKKKILTKVDLKKTKTFEKVIFFDSGPIISLVLSRLDWILPILKEKFGGKFYITPAVKKELVERPIEVKRFEFEALQVMKYIREGVFEVYEDIPQNTVKRLQVLANSSFQIRGKNMDVVQAGEMESVAAALKTGSNLVVMDERTLRLFIEDNSEMEKLLEMRFKNDVVSNKVKMNEFSAQLKGIQIIRSVELVSVAYKLGVLNSYLPKIKGAKEKLLDAVLWATKTNGCAVTEDEINKIKELILK
ncbi:hypothetical protein COY27_05645 [Candidatus Woesearchaeota archaeon CG_4_10_14_0_2_um_filter_33_13]|nr:MAG: hypothetical protein COY27_05645 [Candidatus Woesearchaeota archaeon CG_4_10_14_0_2_um_filter_33_13]